MHTFTNLVPPRAQQLDHVTSVTAFGTTRRRRWSSTSLLPRPVSGNNQRSQAGTAAKRRKNAAHGASRGWQAQNNDQAPEGRKKMSHTSGNILLHLIFSAQ